MDQECKKKFSVIFTKVGKQSKSINAAVYYTDADKDVW